MDAQAQVVRQRLRRADSHLAPVPAQPLEVRDRVRRDLAREGRDRGLDLRSHLRERRAADVTRGYCSETFAFEAIEQQGDDRRPYYVYYLGDFDRSGRDAARSLRKKLEKFGAEKGIEVHFIDLAVTLEQIRELGLPTREPKRNTAADKAWPYDFACELDAIPPDTLRQIVREAIERHLPADQLKILKIAEESEKDLLWALALEHDDDGGEE
jgi:hypothetical protein